MSNPLDDKIQETINVILTFVNSTLESTTNLTAWRKPLNIALESASRMANDCTNTEVIAKIQATRQRFNKIYNLHRGHDHLVNGKYMDISSIFENKKDKMQFVSILQCMEQSKSTEKLPFVINKNIAEYSTGKIKNCYNSQCENEIFTMNGNVSGYKPVFLHCNKTNRYFCQQHIEQTDICDYCDAVQWIADCVKCDASECEHEDSCQYDECEYFVDKNMNCNRCKKILCTRWEHQHESNIFHCAECKQRVCQECRDWCDICDEYICKECVSKYTFNCSSEKCDKSIFNHPSCRKDCECEMEQRELCLDCIKHSCLDYGKLPSKGWCTQNFCAGKNCKICKSTQ